MAKKRSRTAKKHHKNGGNYMGRAYEAITGKAPNVTFKGPKQSLFSTLIDRVRSNKTSSSRTKKVKSRSSASRR